MTLTLLAAILLALVHVYGQRLAFSHAIPRSYWLSLAGGAGVAFVFVHVLPELSSGQQAVDETGHVTTRFIEQHIYLVAMLGLVAYYGAERIVKVHYQGEGLDHHVFWVHIGSFAVYNAIIGYLLVHRDVPGTAGLLLFTIAIMLHFVVNDHALQQLHRRAYRHIGRWLLAGAVIVGWLTGLILDLGEAAIAMLFAFIAGGLILNVLKEELPRERESQFWAFALGAAGYSLLLLVTG
jgi:hypothetical protein